MNFGPTSLSLKAKRLYSRIIKLSKLIQKKFKIKQIMMIARIISE